jgi:uncharacterized protein YkwD
MSRKHYSFATESSSGSFSPMTSSTCANPAMSRALKVAAAIAATMVMVFLANSARPGTDQSVSSIATQSVLRLPSGIEPAPPASSVPTTAPLPTAAPTAMPEPTPKPAPTFVVAVAAGASSGTEPTPAGISATVAPEPTAVPTQTPAELEAYVLGEINKVRANAGLGPLAVDPTISAISRDWSQQMAAGGFFEHRPSTQLDVMLPAGWLQWGENIASAPDIFWSQSTLESSPGHYANMVGPFTHLGIGVFTNGAQVWVTQNFTRYAEPSVPRS